MEYDDYDEYEQNDILYREMNEEDPYYMGPSGEPRETQEEPPTDFRQPEPRADFRQPEPRAHKQDFMPWIVLSILTVVAILAALIYWL